MVLMLDSNKGIDDNEGGLRKITNETLLVDTFTLIKSIECDISTYTRGRKRLDYILTSQNLIPFITQAGYLPFFKANDSNHCGLFIDISNKLLDNKVELKRPEKWMIGSSRKMKEIYEYKRVINHDVENNKLYQRAEEAYVKTFLPTLPRDFEKTNSRISITSRKENVVPKAMRQNG
jgi:hypothetical protein